VSETFNRQQVDSITAPWLNLCKEQEEQITKIQAENDKLQSKIDTAIEQLNEHIHIHVDSHHLDDILFDLEGGCDSFKLELCDEHICDEY
jgi:hypothetical protein